MFNRIKRKRYRERTAALAVSLCPDERYETGGQRLKDLAAKALAAIGDDIIDKGFAAGRTPEQSALAVVGALIAKNAK